MPATRLSPSAGHAAQHLTTGQAMLAISPINPLTAVSGDAGRTNVCGNEPLVQLARWQASAILSREANDGSPVWGARMGRKGTFAMIETVTAVMGLVSAGIFLAHAFEDYRRRGTHHLVQTEPAAKSLVNSNEHRG